MTNLFDYLTWRGDLPMERIPLCPVDALILSALSYVHFGDLIPPEKSIPIGQAAQAYLALPPAQRGRCRCEEDLKLLEALARSPRFSSLDLCRYEDRFIPQEETQFGAMTVLLPDGSAFLAFRGTDATLVGWKEDFNMSFLDTVPAQLAAADYAARFAGDFPGPLLLGGHSKGGNLAVFAAVSCPAEIRDRIQAVYSFDGPGFTQYLLSKPGYPELLTRIFTFIPQSSVVGMLLERKEPCTVVRSGQVGLLQHDPYSWEVVGGSFVEVESVTQGSRVADRALTAWLAELTPQQRETVVDTIYDLLSSGDATLLEDTFRPQNLATALRALKDTPSKDLLAVTDSLSRLVRSAAQAIRQDDP